MADDIELIREAHTALRDHDPDTKFWWRLGDIGLLLAEVDDLRARLATAEKAVADLMTEVSS
jgi:hypothetical protein